MNVDFKDVSKEGIEASPVADALAGLRANEARYFMKKYKIPFEVFPADDQPAIVEYVSTILKERDLKIQAKPLEVAQHEVEEDGLHYRITHVFYDNGLVINILYSLENQKKRAVGLKLSEGMDVPSELQDKFKFARQKSSLAGVISGSFFLIRNNYEKVPLVMK